MTVDISIIIFILAALIFMVTALVLLKKDTRAIKKNQTTITQQQIDMSKRQDDLEERQKDDQADIRAQLINERHERLKLHIEIMQRQEKLREELLARIDETKRLEEPRDDKK